MKIKELLLLEYDRARAAQTIGPNLWKAMVRDILGLWTVRLGSFEKDWESKNPTSFKQWGSALTDTVYQNQLANNALEQLEKADPTSNKKYTQWLARMFARDPVTKLEDLVSTLADYLHKFNKLGLKKLLKPEHADINIFKDIQTFMDVMDDYDLPEDDKDTGKATKLYSDSDVTVIIPHDEAAACVYGRQTRWCTAATKGENYFDHYNKSGPLYILIPKNPKYKGEKYQLHFPSDQFMNEQDHNQDIGWLLSDRFPSLVDFFKKREGEYLNDLIQFTDNAVLEQVLDEISRLMTDKITDIISDWEARDDEYYAWLKDEGYVDDDGDIDLEKAPSYLEYNTEAEDEYSQAIEAVKQTPRSIKDLIPEYKSDYPDDETKVPNIEDILIWHIDQELDSDWARQLVRYLKQNVHIYRGKTGQWEVKKVNQ